jgi:hypothetical protein
MKTKRHLFLLPICMGTFLVLTCNGASAQTTANPSLAATPSSGVVNKPTTTATPAATANNVITPTNPLTQSPQYQTPGANSPMNATPASGQAPAQGASTNAAGQVVSPAPANAPAH